MGHLWTGPVAAKRPFCWAGCCATAVPAIAHTAIRRHFICLIVLQESCAESGRDRNIVSQAASQPDGPQKTMVHRTNADLIARNAVFGRREIAADGVLADAVDDNLVGLCR